MARRYDQHCALAHALDVVGERWTLLIVRELLAGPRRYTDLADGLVSVPTNVLAARLRDMEAQGLVRRGPLPPPAQSIVAYELTEEGAALGSVVSELARWGMRTLPPTPEGRPFRAHWLVLALRARFDADAAEQAGVGETYEFEIDDDDVVTFSVPDGTARLGRASAEPAVRVRASAETFLALTGGAIDAEEALARGARIEGTPEAIERMRATLPVPRAVQPR
jgi:DNA-binding HxlR family transcriptional regulator